MDYHIDGHYCYLYDKLTLKIGFTDETLRIQERNEITCMPYKKINKDSKAAPILHTYKWLNEKYNYFVTAVALITL